LHFVVSRLTGSNLFMLKGLFILAIGLIVSLFIFKNYNLIPLFIHSIFVIILWNSFLIFFINLQNSISFRILREVEMVALKSMSIDEIEKVYPDLKSFEDRLEMMKQNQFIIEAKSQIQITKKGKNFSQFIILFRKLFGIENFG